jgi:SHS2 domain-containing protein
MASRKFEYLPHTADMAFVAYGKDVRQALENAAEALLGIMLDTKRIKKAGGRPRSVAVKETSSSIENLVWYTLQKIVSTVDEKKLNAYKFSVKKLARRGGKYLVSGDLRYKSLKRDSFLLEVKAVTPYTLEIKEGTGGCSIRVLVDV